MIDEKKAVDRDGNGNGSNESRLPQKRQEYGKPRPISSRNRPTMGWQKHAATFAEYIGKPGWAPSPSQRELAERERRAKRLKLVRLTDQVDKLVVAGFNFKGGAGKTPMAAYLSNLLAQETRVGTAFIDGNPGSTSPGLRMGMYGAEEAPDWAKVEPPLPGMYRGTVSTWDVYQALEHRHVTNGRQLRNVMKQNHYGVNTMVAAEDHPRHLADTSALEMIRTVVGFVSDEFPFTFIDPGNDYQHEVQLELAKLSTDLFFPAYVDMVGALRDLPVTLRKLSKPEFGDRVSRSIVVMTGIGRLGKKDSLADYTPAVRGHEVAEIMPVPYDPVIEEHDEVRLDLIQPNTWDALMDVLIAIIERNLEHQEQEAPAQVPEQLNT